MTGLNSQAEIQANGKNVKISNDQYNQNKSPNIKTDVEKKTKLEIGYLH